MYFTTTPENANIDKVEKDKNIFDIKPEWLTNIKLYSSTFDTSISV